MGKGKPKPKGVVNGAKKAVSAAGAIEAVMQYGPSVLEFIEKHIPEKKELVVVPDLCVDGYLLTTAQAEEQLKSKGLTVIFIEARLDDANIKYRGYSEGLVIGSDPKANTKVEPGSMIKVKYISQKVIDESMRLYKEIEAHKIDILNRKKAQKRQRNKKVSQAIQHVKDTPKMIPRPFVKKFVLVKSKPKSEDN